MFNPFLHPHYHCVVHYINSQFDFLSRPDSKSFLETLHLSIVSFTTHASTHACTHARMHACTHARMHAARTHTLCHHIGSVVWFGSVIDVDVIGKGDVVFVIIVIIYFVEIVYCAVIHCIFLGNDYLHDVISHAYYTLRIDMERFHNENKYVAYSNFTVASEGDKYRLSIGAYTGTAGDRI